MKPGTPGKFVTAGSELQELSTFGAADCVLGPKRAVQCGRDRSGQRWGGRGLTGRLGRLRKNGRPEERLFKRES